MTGGTISQQPETWSDRSRADLILEVTRRFTSTLELSAVLGQVLSLTVDAIGAERGSIFVLDRSGVVIHKILARWYLPPSRSQEVISIVLSQGAAGHVYRHKQPVLVADTGTDERWIHLPDDPYITGSALCVPLLYRDQLNGILTLTHAQPLHFSEDDLTLACSIAGQAAVAIENACLFDRVRQERAMLQAVVSGVAEALVITDNEGRILYANPASATALGVRAVAVRGQSLQNVAPDGHMLELLQVLLSTGQPQRGEVQGSDGRTYEASLVTAPSAGVVMTLHDVTHFKELDALRSDFVTAVSHDLKSPLGQIYSCAWMLAEVANLDPEARRFVDLILDGIQKMEQLVTSLLDLTAIEAGVDQIWEPVELSGLIRETLAVFELKVKEKNLQVTVHIDPELPQVQGHPVRLGQAISNLVSNAVNYTPAGGCVLVSAAAGGDEVQVQVSDTGPGIPLEKQAGLFHKFFKVRGKETRPFEGQGLGLAIVKSVVEAHKGRVWVESAIGQGATFTIALPLTPPSPLSDDSTALAEA